MHCGERKRKGERERQGKEREREGERERERERDVADIVGASPSCIRYVSECGNDNLYLFKLNFLVLIQIEF